MEINLPSWLPLMGIISLALFLGALLTLPLIIAALPRDVFMGKGREKKNHPLLAILLLIFRNAIGLVLFLMGFIMLFIPGQGLLTMLAGLVLMKFPGKAYLVHRLLSLSSLQHGLNLIRKRMKREPFLFPPYERKE